MISHKNQTEESFIEWLDTEYPYSEKLQEDQIDELRLAYISKLKATDNYKKYRQIYININNSYNNSNGIISYTNDFDKSDINYNAAIKYLDECNDLLMTLQKKFDNLYNFDREQYNKGNSINKDLIQRKR